MIVVKVELHSAITGHIINLGTAIIANVGGSETLGNYKAQAYRKGTEIETLYQRRDIKPIRNGSVENHKRLSEPVWNLVWKALGAMGYGEETKTEK